MMVKVKICGITNASDALTAVHAGADALGFVFYKHSPRYVDAALVRSICIGLGPFVHRVGVFVDADQEHVQQTAEFCGLDYVQLHGHETPRYCASIKDVGVIKALRVRSTDDLKELGHYSVHAYLLDTYVEGEPGGTGQVFDWSLARGEQTVGRPVILAGGLGPENVAEAVWTARPYAVDVSSGVEVEPGRKDRLLVESFVRNAKSVVL